MGQRADQLSGSDTADPEALASDIAHTRAEMSGTLDAIQQRLSPETIGEQAKDTASDITAQAKEAALEVLDHALAGAKEQALEVVHEVQSQAQEVLTQAREVLSEARVTAREVLGEAKTTAREAVEDATTQAKAAVRGATIGKVETMVRSANETTNAARHGLVETIKANPFPAAMVGLGLGWLLINSRSEAARGASAPRALEAQYREHRPTPPAYGSGAPTAGDRLGSAAGSVQTAAGNIAGQAGDLAGRAGGSVGSAVGQVGETAGNVVGQIGTTAGNVVGQIGETAGSIASGTMETAGNIAEQAQYQALRLEDGFQRVMRDNPLAVGAVAVALGAAVGLMLPQTERENQLMGEARDSLMERAQEMAQETIGKVQSVASEAQQTVTETVKDEAKKQGLTQ